MKCCGVQIDPAFYLHRAFATKGLFGREVSSNVSNLPRSYGEMHYTETSINTRRVMSFGGTLSAAIVFGGGLFCHAMKLISNSITGFACTALCVLAGYILGLLIGAGIGAVYARCQASQDNVATV